jgi:hypothetical protein
MKVSPRMTVRAVLGAALVASAALAQQDTGRPPEQPAPTVQEIRQQRLDLVARPGFHPSDMITAEGLAMDEMNAQLGRRRFVAAYERMQKLLVTYPTSLPGHTMLMNLFEGLPEEAEKVGFTDPKARAAVHREWTDRIVDAVVGGMSCQQPADGCKVISPMEVSWTKERLGCKERSRRKETIEQVAYDVRVCQDGKTLYFDTSAYPADWR